MTDTPLIRDVQHFIAEHQRQAAAAERARAELRQFAAAWERPPTLVIAITYRPSRWGRLWRRLRGRR